MIGDLAGYLKFDPLLAAAIILAVTLVLGRTVDMVRARLEQKRNRVQPDAVEFAQRFKDGDASGTADS